MLKNGSYCPCIESKMPKSPRTSVEVTYTDQIERYSGGTQANETPGLSYGEMVAKLEAFGLSEPEIEILMARNYENLTFQEIIKNYGWTSVGSASHFYRMTLRKLRERGFKLNGS